MARILKHKGIALVAAIMLIVFVTIAVLGVVQFVMQRLQQQPVEKAALQRVYSAQAGVYDAIYNYFNNYYSGGTSYFSLGKTNIDANNFFVLSATAAGLLQVNTSLSGLDRSGDNVTGWTVQDVTNSNPITITAMTVSWSGGTALLSISFNNSTKWSGNVSSGTTLDRTYGFAAFTLNATPAPTLYNNNSLNFSGSMSGATVSVIFTMSDGTKSQALQIYNNGPTSNNNFTVTSQGQTTGSNVTRSITATYNAATGAITNYTGSVL